MEHNPFEELLKSMEDFKVIMRKERRRRKLIKWGFWIALAIEAVLITLLIMKP